MICGIILVRLEFMDLISEIIFQGWVRSFSLLEQVFQRLDYMIIY